MTIPHEDFNTYLAARLRDERERRGWTREEMATHLRNHGIAYDHDKVNRTERVLRLVPASELFLLCGLFPGLMEDLASRYYRQGQLSAQPSVPVGDMPAVSQLAERSAAREMGVPWHGPRRCSGTASHDGSIDYPAADVKGVDGFLVCGSALRSPRWPRYFCGRS
jgi:hypothetical protein